MGISEDSQTAYVIGLKKRVSNNLAKHHRTQVSSRTPSMARKKAGKPLKPQKSMKRLAQRLRKIEKTKRLRN